jgi:hypothetical protein
VCVVFYLVGNNLFFCVLGVKFVRRQTCFAFDGFHPDRDDVTGPTPEEIEKWTVPLDLERLGNDVLGILTRMVFVDKQLRVFTPCSFDKVHGKMKFVNLTTMKIFLPDVDGDWFNPEQQVRVLVPYDD